MTPEHRRSGRLSYETDPVMVSRAAMLLEISADRIERAIKCDAPGLCGDEIDLIIRMRSAAYDLWLMIE
jgi:hypothetical protein